MMEKYYIVDGAILPEVFDKVIEARTMLEKGEVRKVSDAVKKVGISRGTYYKYKDYVFLPNQSMAHSKAIISLMLQHDNGVLSQVLTIMADANANILTINQNIPIQGRASVVISFDVEEMTMAIDELMQKLHRSKGVFNLYLMAIE